MSQQVMAKEKVSQLPVDRGWAWVIVAAACLVYGLGGGGIKSQGVLLVELAERFEGVYTTSTLIWVFTVKYTLAASMAPLIGLLVVKFSHRTVAACGIILDVIGFIGMAYAPNLPCLIFLHSVFTGVGEGMVILSPLLVSAQYFSKWKALALGLIASGSGIAQIIQPHVYRFFFDNYDFQGACLLVGGFYLQFLVPVCLLRPLSYYCRESVSIDQLEVDVGDDEVSNQLEFPSAEAPLETRERSISFSHRENTKAHACTQFRSLSAIPTTTTQGSGQTIARAGLVGSIILSGKDSNHGSTQEYKERFIWKIILKPKYLLVAGSMFLYSFGAMALYQCLGALSKEYGMSKSAVALTIMMGGAVEIPSRICNGILADKKFLTCSTQYALALFIPGLTCLLGALVSGPAGVVLILLGMSAAGTSTYSLVPIVIGELLGAEYVTSGMSIQIFGQSFAFLSSSYIIGAIYDASGSWKAVYLYVATVMMASSWVVWPYCLYQWCQTKHPTGRSESKGIEDCLDT